METGHLMNSMKEKLFQELELKIRCKSFSIVLDNVWLRFTENYERTAEQIQRHVGKHIFDKRKQ